MLTGRLYRSGRGFLLKVRTLPELLDAEKAIISIAGSYPFMVSVSRYRHHGKIYVVMYVPKKVVRELGLPEREPLPVKIYAVIHRGGRATLLGTVDEVATCSR